MTKKWIDFRSDTVTRPTEAMRRAMAEAEVGDDVYQEDPTMNRLEEMAAERLGKEAALFVPSGTMANQIAVKMYTQPGDEIILEELSHMFLYEVGGPAFHSGVQVRTLQGKRGAIDPQEVEAAIRVKNIHFPRTALICIENSHNNSGGCVVPLQTIEEIHRIAAAHGIPVYLDGARIFNASIASGVPVQKYASLADSVMFCFSKGLGAPIGSVLVGSREFIDGARKMRKRFGGGMRQAGVIAAAAIIALEEMVDRLAEDHENARRLADGLEKLPSVELLGKPVETNMVLIDLLDLPGNPVDAQDLVSELRKERILAGWRGGQRVRFVTHKDVNREDVNKLLQVTEQILGS